MRVRDFGMVAAVLAVGLITMACDDAQYQPSADHQQRVMQEKLEKEATSQTGMPAIKNFREKKLMKELLELRDQDGLTTYTYTFAENSGTKQLLCESVGYPLPAATEYTNPQKPLNPDYHDSGVIAQADPNGLFSPSSAEGTWVMCFDREAQKVRPVYAEPRVIVSPFKLSN